MRLQPLEARRGHDHVNVRRPPRVAPSRVEHEPDRPVVWNRVRHGPHADKRVRSIFAAVKAAAQVRFRRLCVLHRVQPVITVLPDVQLCACDRSAVLVEHPTPNQRRGSAGALGSALSVTTLGSVRGPERPEDGGLSGSVGARMRQRVDQHGQAQNVGPQDEFLAAFVGDLDRPGPLVFRHLHFGPERVQMAHERLHDLAQPRIWATFKTGSGRRGDVRGDRAGWESRAVHIYLSLES